MSYFSISMSAQYKKIMIVEDDDDIRETLKIALEFKNYPVMEASNGLTALKVLENEPPPCLILLDLMMPEMDGWQFVEEVQKKPQYEKIPIVVLTAFTGEAKNIGYAKEILKKPIDFEDLLKVIGRYCHD